jgi:hypothetical protein
MAFSKFAKASVTTPSIDMQDWLRISRPNSKSRTASKIIDGYDPKDYLFTHCTIISSVDTEEVPGIKLGMIKEAGSSINRKFNDYYVTPNTAIYINGNGDAWERRLLLATYKTFVGGENYHEHVQIKEQSKGKILDAVARDCGDSIYVDILVATHRKHEDLIENILTGKLRTLSMGCETAYCTCTKCGNVATDETELCSCIRYSKGTTFRDASNTERKVAELCGHRDDPKSVTFIEASWVADPAFIGAVVHHILNPNILDMNRVSQMLKQAHEDDKNDHIAGLKRAASMKRTAEDDEDWEDPFEDTTDDTEDTEDTDTEDMGSEDTDSSEDTDTSDAEESDSTDNDFDFDFGSDGLDIDDTPNTYNDLLDNLKTRALEDVWKTIVEDVNKKEDDPVEQLLTTNENDTLLEAKRRVSRNVRKAASLSKRHGVKALRNKFSGLELILSAKHQGVDFSFDEIITLMKAGSITKYPNKEAFLKKCQYLFNKLLDSREIKRFVLGGYLLGLERDNLNK